MRQTLRTIELARMMIAAQFGAQRQMVIVDKPKEFKCMVCRCEIPPGKAGRKCSACRDKIELH